ncbi:MAG TPA: glycoside hydrolase family 27 protein [Opitutaceae bacterium]|nr:glycoside hydrolase family 27 protein [Opitutaceae bacterium]
MNLRIVACLLLALSATRAAAADLSGTWRIDVPRRGGVTLHTYFVLRQHGAELDGKVVIHGGVDLPLRKAHLEGADGVFGTDWNTDYRLHPDGDRLRVTISYGGHGSEEATAVRVPEAEANPPPVIPLPALEPVPANGLAPTPPMGWNSWNHFGDRVDDQIVRETADALVRTGLAAAGYVYVNIDDTWEGARDAQGNIVPNTKFPDMKALADYVHQRGLKLGIYSSPGPKTCGGYEGSYGHEEQDAQTFAGWGIDYLKYDWCSAGRLYPDSALPAGYQKMGRALARSGRPIVYSLCEYGMGDVWKWGPQVGGNLWRTTGDIQDNWASMSEIGFNQSRLAPYAGPGHWNDPDMLEVGNGGMTTTEYRTHFSLWCLLAAPLMAGNDLRTMSAETLAILSNREVIALDQDVLGRQGERLSSRDAIEIWTKPLHDGGRAIGVFNRNDTAKAVQLAWKELGRSAPPKTLRDLWQHRDLPVAADGWSGTILAHDVLLLRVQ